MSFAATRCEQATSGFRSTFQDIPEDVFASGQIFHFRPVGSLLIITRFIIVVFASFIAMLLQSNSFVRSFGAAKTVGMLAKHGSEPVSANEFPRRSSAWDCYYSWNDDDSRSCSSSSSSTRTLQMSDRTQGKVRNVVDVYLIRPSILRLH